MSVVEVDSAAVWPPDAAGHEEAILADWFVRAGSEVTEGEILCEIRIEDVGVDVPAPASGTVTKLFVAETGEFERGDPLARIVTG